MDLNDMVGCILLFRTMPVSSVTAGHHQGIQGIARVMECRIGCGACCIAPSISSPIPGMPQGKPAGVRCIQLDDENRCMIFGRPERPAVCASLRPTQEMCGSTNEEALINLTVMEEMTKPAGFPILDLGSSIGEGGD